MATVQITVNGDTLIFNFNKERASGVSYLRDFGDGEPMVQWRMFNATVQELAEYAEENYDLPENIKNFISSL